MATKIFGVTPNQPLGSSAATPTSFLFYDGYQQLSDLRIRTAGPSSATPNLLDDNTIFVDIGDTVLIVDYRSKASFSNYFLNAVPDVNSVTRIYNILLNREPDTNELAHFTNTTNFTTNNAVIDEIRFNPEYRLNKSSLFEYPILIYNQNGNLVWQSNDYTAYVDYGVGLKPYYDNADNPWDYNFDGSEIPIQGTTEDPKTQADFGQDHYQHHGRGEGRTFASFNITEVDHFTIRTTQSENRFGGIIIKNYTANTFKNHGLISANEVRTWMNNHQGLGSTLSQKNISINSLFSKAANGVKFPQADVIINGDFDPDENGEYNGWGWNKYNSGYYSTLLRDYNSNTSRYAFTSGGAIFRHTSLTAFGSSQNDAPWTLIIKQFLDPNILKNPLILSATARDTYITDCYVGFELQSNGLKQLDPRIKYSVGDIINTNYPYLTFYRDEGFYITKNTTVDLSSILSLPSSDYIDPQGAEYPYNGVYLVIASFAQQQPVKNGSAWPATEISSVKLFQTRLDTLGLSQFRGMTFG